MKLEVRKEIPELFYIRCRAGIGRHEKTFVRTYFKRKNGKAGSKMYCSARHTALLFDRDTLAMCLMGKYNTANSNVVKYDYEKHTPDYIKKNYVLEEIQVYGIPCYTFVRK